MPPLDESLENEVDVVSFPSLRSEEEGDARRAGRPGAARGARKADRDAVGEVDLLQLYMRDVGRADHLTKEEEAEVIALIQHSRSAILADTLRVPGVVDRLLSWRDAYVRGAMPLRDIIEVVGSYEEHRARSAEETEVETAAAGRLPMREAALRPGVLAAFDRLAAMRAAGHDAWAGHHAEAVAIVEGLRLVQLRQTELQDVLLAFRRDLHAAEGRLLRHAQPLAGKREELVALIASGRSADDLAERLGAELSAQPGVSAALQAMREVEGSTGLRLDELRGVSASVRTSMKAYEGACKRLFCAHAGFVANIARRFEASGAALVDLIQTGNLGLLRAVEKFEPGRSRFATYAEFWIRQFIAESIPGEVNTVHVASTVADLSRRVAKAQEISLALNMKELTIAELSEQLGEPVDKIRESLSTNGRAVSLDQPVGQGEGEEGETPLKDVIADEESRTPYEVTLQSELSRTFRRLLSRLPEQALRVVALRFGLDNGVELSPDEAARVIGISRDKLARLEQSALRALRSPVQSPEIWSYSRQFG